MHRTRIMTDDEALPPTLYLRRLADVIREKRGSGAAAGLIRTLAKWFVAQNALKICVDVEPSNTVARRFYARHGAEDLKPHWMVWNDIRVVLEKQSR